MMNELNRTKTLLGLLTATGAALAMSACGVAGENALLNDGNGKETTTLDNERTTDVEIGIVAADSGFKLAAPTTNDFVVAISSCSSGYTTTVTSTTASPKTSVPLYTGDGGCVAGLTSFVWNSITYTKSGGGNLTTGSSLFVNGANELFVTVGTQLSATIAGGSKAVFLISEVKAGADYAISGYSTSAGLTVSILEAPELEIPANGITLTSINATTGVATFAVNVQCANTNSPGPTSCRTPGGDDQLFTNMKAKLVTDTFGGELDYSDASTAMASGATSISAPNLSVAAPITNEGFLVSLAGGGQLYTNKNMILIIEYTDVTSSTKSYRYFNVDIGDPQ